METPAEMNGELIVALTTAGKRAQDEKSGASSDAGIPLIALILPISAFACADPDQRINEFNAFDVLRMFVT